MPGKKGFPASRTKDKGYKTTQDEISRDGRAHKAKSLSLQTVLEFVDAGTNFFLRVLRQEIGVVSSSIIDK